MGHFQSSSIINEDYSVIIFVMIATFKSEDTGILNRSKIKASISVQTMHGDLEGRRNRVYSTQGARFWHPSP